MKSYRLFFYQAGHIRDVAEFFAEDDEAALAHVEELRNGRPALP